MKKISVPIKLPLYLSVDSSVKAGRYGSVKTALRINHPVTMKSASRTEWAQPGALLFFIVFVTTLILAITTCAHAGIHDMTKNTGGGLTGNKLISVWYGQTNQCGAWYVCTTNTDLTGAGLVVTNTISGQSADMVVDGKWHQVGNCNGSPLQTYSMFSVSMTGQIKKDGTLTCAAHVYGVEGSQMDNQKIPIQALRTCDAKIADVDFGNITAGSTATSIININKAGDGNGTITITGSDLSSGGDLHLEGRDDVLVRPTEDRYVDSKGHWVSGPADNTIPLTLKAGSEAPGGEYKSNLTATLTCE